MNNLVFLNMMIFIIIAFLLMTFAVFSIGFLIGYKVEDRKILRKKQDIDNAKNEESEQERKAKKEWKKFLEYDGSTPSGVEN